ncbi:hypothetical protein G4177_00610 [Corallococcus sp. ZKHCc1 1396]|uniref:Uncharacterized protein n=1 Tax=Corallococcus soli TaxID=2710757 RepID=A0ABR9PFI0_9BACT|nr:hypothetical protein [Corallococcus soli]MBE4746671.1 hypothetical protein [Corallococcus soli]
MSSHPLIARHAGDVVASPFELGDPLAASLYRLTVAVEAFSELLEEALPLQDATSLVIQIQQPESFGALAETAVALERFFNVLAQLEDEQGHAILTQPTVHAFDTGSFWMEAVTGSLAALNLVGLVSRFAHIVVTQYQQFTTNALYIEALRIQLKETASAQKFGEELRAGLATTLAGELKEKHFSKGKAETINILRQAIIENSKLIEQGVKLMPALGAPKSVQDAFPTAEEHSRIQAGLSSNKLLSSKAETNNASQESPKKAGS